MWDLYVRLIILEKRNKEKIISEYIKHEVAPSKHVMLSSQNYVDVREIHVVEQEATFSRPTVQNRPFRVLCSSSTPFNNW